jgi:hypothetical protein
MVDRLLRADDREQPKTSGIEKQYLVLQGSNPGYQ